MNLELSEEELSILSSNLVCRLDDYESEIKRHEKREGKRLDMARIQHSKLTRIVYLKLIPKSLCGELVLMDGQTIRPAP